MNGKTERRSPEIVLRNGKPVAVILDIDEYREMLEQLEDWEGLEILENLIRENYPIEVLKGCAKGSKLTEKLMESRKEDLGLEKAKEK